MGHKIVRVIGTLVVGIMFFVPTGLSVSAASPDPVTQKSQASKKAAPLQPMARASISSEKAERISKLDDAANARKRDRKIQHREPSVTATPLNSRRGSAKTAAASKAAFTAPAFPMANVPTGIPAGI